MKTGNDDTAMGNIALRKPAFQISTYFSTPASLANDGNSSSLFCTSYHYRPWWAVDLEDWYTVENVTIRNDADEIYRTLHDDTILLVVDYRLPLEP